MLRAQRTGFKIATMRRAGALFVACCGLAACETEQPEPAREPRSDGRRVESSVRGEPVRQGFTHPPPHDAGWLPPPPPPFLSTDELELANETPVDEEGRSQAQSDLLPLVTAFEEGVGEELIAKMGEIAREHARAGRLLYVDAETLYDEHLFPNDIDAAERKYKGKLVVVTARVAPENMTNPADGFKLFRRDPYVHEPLLLETPYELNFVRCHLARAEDQKLSDWQTAHLLAIVEGKDGGDLVLRRCVVLTALR